MSFKHDITTRNALWYIILSSAVLMFSCVAIERYHAAAWPFGGSVGSVMGACALGPMLLSLPWLFRTPAQCNAIERTRSLSAPVCALALLLLGASSLFSGQMMIATGNSDNGLFIADYLTQDRLNRSSIWRSADIPILILPAPCLDTLPNMDLIKLVIIRFL